MKIVGKTDRGKIRATNQDAYMTAETAFGSAWVVVCDGMGGAAGGNIASSTAVKTVASHLSGSLRVEMGANSVRNLLISAVSAANSIVYEMSKANSALEGMGTTIVAAVINGDLAHIVSVGDSRAYLLGDEIRQITRDHSVVQEMLENGDVTVEEARTHPQKNIITRALGVQKKVDIDYMEEVLLPSEKLLICTDGLTNMVLDSEILALANSAETSSLADKLVALAIEKGGTDNITVVFIEN